MPLPPPVDDDIELNPPAGSERASSSWQGSWAELWQASEGQQAPCHGTGQTSLQAAPRHEDDRERDSFEYCLDVLYKWYIVRCVTAEQMSSLIPAPLTQVEAVLVPSPGAFGALPIRL